MNDDYLHVSRYNLLLCFLHRSFDILQLIQRERERECVCYIIHSNAYNDIDLPASLPLAHRDDLASLKAVPQLGFDQ